LETGGVSLAAQPARQARLLGMVRSQSGSSNKSMWKMSRCINSNLYFTSFFNSIYTFTIFFTIFFTISSKILSKT
jgi:hypothetical protein